MDTDELQERVQGLIAGGDVSTAATETLRGLGQQILQYLYVILRDSDDADDAFSQFAEGLWTGLAGFRGDGSLKAWCYRVAWHSALRVLRDPYRRRHQRLPSSDAERLAAEIRSTTSPSSEARQVTRLERLRSALDPDERCLIVLRFDRNLSWREVARVLEEEGNPVDEAALRKRFERLKNRLRELDLSTD